MIILFHLNYFAELTNHIEKSSKILTQKLKVLQFLAKKCPTNILLLMEILSRAEILKIISIFYEHKKIMFKKLSANVKIIIHIFLPKPGKPGGPWFPISPIIPLGPSALIIYCTFNFFSFL